MASGKPRERKAVLLRLDPSLHEALQRWAKDELRSLNAHAEFLLRRALQREGRLRPRGASDGVADGVDAADGATDGEEAPRDGG